MKNVDQVSTYAIYVNSFNKTYKDPQPYDLGKSNSKVYDDITRKNFSSPSCSTWKKEKKRKKKDNKLQLISYVHFESDTRHIFIPDQRGASLYLLYEQKRKRERERERGGRRIVRIQIEPVPDTRADFIFKNMHAQLYSPWYTLVCQIRLRRG